MTNDVWDVARQSAERIESAMAREVERDARPVCGDFCDLCGDCIACYGEDECYFAPDGKHVKNEDGP